ncbi:breast cancer type 1 susceptibility protein isoform X3 [Tyto alba]|uniref:breast cancer type 1 susceptibility protein isoform X3 n=1 Tax=Tyto alba TaxID=56313 RepID=UPI001C685359|nr:breast cancer type 1 susceptibility protein isoform X3 [Tyto alba]
MDLSVIAIGDVQNVLSAMQKNLECPICLDMVEEPVSTKCDHIFCRFCMFKLLSKKKKGVIQCPLCKTDVTKRSLKENPRFKQLIDSLLETMHAFELDTGVKFLNSHRFPKTSTETTSAEFLCKESSVIQSKGFRNRKKSAKENGQENFTLHEANVDTQLTDTRFKRCSLRNKTQKCDPEKGIYIEFGSDSSEEIFKQADNTGLEDKEALKISSQEKLEELKSAEKGKAYSCSTQPDKLGDKEIILPNVVGESDFSKEGLSKKSTWSIPEYAKPGQVNITEYQSSPLNVHAVDLLTEQCDRIGNASPLRNGDTSFFKNTEEMNAEKTQCNSKSKDFDLKDSSESTLDKSKEMDTVAQSVKAVEMYDPEKDSFNEKELPLEKLLQPETFHCAIPNQVSRKRLKRSIQKVNEWFSKSNEIMSSNSSQDDSAGASDVSGEGDTFLSDKDSCISAKTDTMVDSLEIAVVEGNRRLSKQTADSIKDKIFGKTYKRGRKSKAPIILRDILPTTKKEDVADKCLNNSSKDRLKRKRKTSYVLQPEDFIKKDTEEAGEVSGYDSETSYVEDSCGAFSQGEILTTQQKNAMQNNLKKLQQEMAVLEAVLNQHGSQDREFLPLHRELPHSSSERTLGMEEMRQRGAESTSEGNFENHKCSSSKGFSVYDFHVIPSDSLNSKIKELNKERSQELLLPSSKSCLLKRPDLKKGLQCDSVLKNKAATEKTKPLQEAVQECSHCRLEAENADEQKSGTRLNSASVLSNLSGNVTRSPNNSFSSVTLLKPRTAEATDSSVVAQNANKGCAQECKSKRSVCFPISVLYNTAGKENATSAVVTNRKGMSIVASGLNQSEHLVVWKFARQTQSTLSNHITEGTTHVIMKTDKELVCERTLKYFLGIAGRKWVVSYQWVIQSFKEGRILDEENFEVRGDVINGRNHQGPKRARESLTEKIFKDFEICCYGPFTDMTTEHLEWMVELCGASVVKQLHLFTHTTNSTAVVVVQPDAWMENTDYRAIQQKDNIAMVTREWVLDSVACYECQEFNAYLVS